MLMLLSPVSQQWWRVKMEMRQKVLLQRNFLRSRRFLAMQRMGMKGRVTLILLGLALVHTKI